MREIYEAQLSTAKKGLKVAVWFKWFDVVFAVLNFVCVVWQLVDGRFPLNGFFFALMVPMWFWERKKIKTFKREVELCEQLIKQSAI